MIENNFVTDPAHTDFSSGWTSVLEPQGLSQLLAQIHIQVKPTASPKAMYFRNNKIASVEKAKKQIKKSGYTLKTLEQSAFDSINHLLTEKQQLDGHFKLSDVKKAFRHAARRAHPDCGGSHEVFLQLKTNTEILLAFLSTIK